MMEKSHISKPHLGQVQLVFAFHHSCELLAVCGRAGLGISAGKIVEDGKAKKKRFDNFFVGLD